MSKGLKCSQRYMKRFREERKKAEEKTSSKTELVKELTKLYCVSERRIWDLLKIDDYSTEVNFRKNLNSETIERLQPTQIQEISKIKDPKTIKKVIKRIEEKAKETDENKSPIKVKDIEALSKPGIEDKPTKQENHIKALKQRIKYLESQTCKVCKEPLVPLCPVCRPEPKATEYKGRPTTKELKDRTPEYKEKCIKNYSSVDYFCQACETKREDCK